MNPNNNIPHLYPPLGEHHLAYLKIRVLKIRSSEDSCEYIITRIPSARKILKPVTTGVGAVRFLSAISSMLQASYISTQKSPDFLQQEVYARLTMYNFGIFLANQAAAEYERKKKKPGNKYRYCIDFSAALRKAKDYYLRRPDQKPVDIIRLLYRFIHAVKEEYRQFARPHRGIGAIHFNYR